MKKALYTLFFLLFVLILSCVYTKTYTLYTLNPSEEQSVTTPHAQQTLLNSIKSSIVTLLSKEETKNVSSISTDKSMKKIVNIPETVSYVTAKEEIKRGKHYLRSLLKEEASSSESLSSLLEQALKDRRIKIKKTSSILEKKQTKLEQSIYLKRGN